MRNRDVQPLLILFLAFVLPGCGSSTKAKYASGVPALDVDPTVKGPVSGVGIEAHDISAMTDTMMRDLLRVPELASREKAPRVIVDDSDFRNEGSQPINRKLIVNKLRTALARSAKGRMKFLGREFADSVEKERQLKRDGVTDIGTTGLTKAHFGADYKMTGTIATLDSYSAATGLQQRYTQITFEMLDLESGELIWSNQYELQRAAADDVSYR
ncbi:penicillin-binding protein activator LpoB [Methylococcus sp. Mc7]|uniref:penicillin-binding protein activator LpoB n=1 Tax=Methylococcus sp. Mc7 TaxID=2860258 RepID=UPI001C52BD9F|nr:penicillin-binding protein activator LpoB [Methylococcus sp. Mc7]QXP85657.1 penicillin-binding protein activator LpoB [Methylococcus sp. Mc7]